MRLGIIEEIIPEPVGGAHRDFGEMCQSVGEAIENQLAMLDKIPGAELVEHRYKRFRCLGAVEDYARENAVKQDAPVPHGELNGAGPGTGSTPSS